ncbi:tol-pal system protein YbgF [Lysobacter spongiicola DSM 21749]|uniref:Cell division coordinator CpoB n=2 Tax=Novilysobacter TaxID=3382699 RepID=A0A1T4QXM7_9GAMM|nr:tol-pal system protein YbgF [Lysobacter spongiicola]SKA08510.1 tol-pal system protein YbgF [Lysobacter spongiicola DSM 21749]
MMRKLSVSIATSLVAAAALVAAAPVSAQRMSLAERVAVLEQQASNNQTSVDLLRQVNMLKDEVVSLRSQIEQMAHDQEQAQRTARAQYLDLDGRLSRLEGTDPASTPDLGAAPPADAGTVAAPVVPPPSTAPSVYGDPGKLDEMAGEREAYDAAFDVLKAGRYDESATMFRDFLDGFPSGAYAPNALYWLGESYYVTQNYELAIEQFEALLERYPTHDKAPGALLKVGLSQQGLQQDEAAERTLVQVTTRYPGTDAARIASDRLGAMQLGRLR